MATFLVYVMYIFPMPNPCELKCWLVFLLKLVAKVFLGMYINAVTRNWLGLDRIKFGSVFKPSLKPSL
jgi:hypothetical protein